MPESFSQKSTNSCQQGSYKASQRKASLWKLNTSFLFAMTNMN